MSTTYGPWHKTPIWLRWLGRPHWRRAIYASPYIGGGWDDWEYSENPNG